MSLNPCADNFAVEKTQTTFNKGEAQNHQHTEKDLCSPFCSCMCCSTRFTAKTLPSASLSALQNNSEYIQSKTSKPIDIAISIWQPPKLA